MLTEANRMTLMQDIYENIDFRYPLASGSSQYDFNTSGTKTVFRGREPFEMVYPAVKIDFLPKSQNLGQGINSVYSDFSGVLVFAFGELEPVIMTVYTHQQCRGNSGDAYHGKIIADSLTRRIEKRIRRNWPALLSGMESRIHNSFPFQVFDTTSFQQGTERQSFELTFHIITTNKWDNLIDPAVLTTGYVFTDAVLSGNDQTSYENGQSYTKFHTVSGLIGI